MGKQYMDMDFNSHEVQTIYPPITPYLYKKLEKKYVDYLWKIIKKGKKQKEGSLCSPPLQIAKFHS